MNRYLKSQKLVQGEMEQSEKVEEGRDMHNEESEIVESKKSQKKIRGRV